MTHHDANTPATGHANSPQQAAQPCSAPPDQAGSGTMGDGTAAPEHLSPEAAPPFVQLARNSPSSTTRFLVIAAAMFCVACMLDTKTYELFSIKAPILESDSHRAFRIAGYLPTWIVLALAFYLYDAQAFRQRIGIRWWQFQRWTTYSPLAILGRPVDDTAGMLRGVHPRHAWRFVLDRALLILLAPIFTGLLAEGMKLLARRERPDMCDGQWAFREWADRPLSISGLGLPSGHAAVAFAAAFMLCRLHPESRYLWVGIALGCAASRVYYGAHFLSDVVLSGILAYAVTAAIWHVYEGKPSPRPAMPER